MANFSKSERYVLELFKKGTRFMYKGKEYVVDISGKPTTSTGEPKTDIYVKCNNVKGQKDEKEFKISFKKKNADFLENKMTSLRAQQIFGEAWEERIIDFTSQIKENFLNRPLIFKKKYKRTNAGSITLGWKFELVNKSGGELANKIKLPYDAIVEVYSGKKLDSKKRNAMVNGIEIPESGVANYMLNDDIELLKSAQDAVNNLIHIEHFAKINPDIYFACKALNYRTLSEKKKKYDGDRPLAVYIVWNVINGYLTPDIKFNKPLSIGGNYVAKKLEDSLKRLNIENTNDINKLNVSSMDYVIEK